MSKYKKHLQRFLELSKEGYTSRQIAKICEHEFDTNFDSAAIIKALKTHPEYKPKFKFGGAHEAKDIQPLPSSVEEQMERNGLINNNGSRWSLTWLKDKNGNSTLVRNTSEVVSIDQVLQQINQSLKKYVPKFPKITRKPVTDPHLLVIDIADLHIGKLAHREETNDKYNNDIAIQRAIEGVDGILQKAQGFDIDKILFVIGNDVLHTDGHTSTTTSGTPQDLTKKWHQNFNDAKELYVKIIERLLKIADIHIVHNPSNHDFVAGYMLAQVIKAYFRSSENISFDTSINHRKYYRYGQSLIGTSHGDGAKLDQLPLIMANEAKQDWADTYWHYIYLHHIHHKDYFKFRSGKDYQGCTVEYLRSPSGTDSWHHKQGYTLAPKAIEGFLHSKEFGQVARLTHLFK